MALTNFINSAKELSRNPLGIISLFIMLVYGFACLLFNATSNHLTPDERILLIWFIVIFPVLVLILFGWLVSCHHSKLYAPKDFRDDESFIKSFHQSQSQPSELITDTSIELSTTSVTKDYYTLYLEGDKLLSNREYEAAVKKYEEAISLNDKYTNAYINLGVAYHNLWSITKDNKYLKKSADASKRALELNPKGYRPRINLAVIYSKSDETKDEALKLFEEADHIGRDAEPLLRGKVKLFKSQIIADKLLTAESEKFEARIPEIQKDLNQSVILFQKASWANPEALYWIKQPGLLLDYINSEAWK